MNMKLSNSMNSTFSERVHFPNCQRSGVTVMSIPWVNVNQLCFMNMKLNNHMNSTFSERDSSFPQLPKKLCDCNVDPLRKCSPVLFCEHEHETEQSHELHFFRESSFPQLPKKWCDCNVDPLRPRISTFTKWWRKIASIYCSTIPSV